jgi:hypothetical protein
MPSILKRVLAAGLVLLLGAGSAPARARERGTVTTPYVVFHPGTPREFTWFLGKKGPLATGKALTQEEVRSFLAALDGGAPLPAVASVAGKLGRGQRLQAWEHQLWKDYLAHLGERAALVEAGRDDLRPTAEDRRNMALRVALGRLLPALAEGLGEELQPERILYAVVGSVVVYLGMWAVPEPISKTVALGVTVVMLVAFGAELLAHVVAEWKALVAATAAARTFAEVEEAGERFGRAVGEDGARLLFVLASLALGRDLHGVLKRLPRAPPGAPALEAALPGGMRVRLPVPSPATQGAAAGVAGGQVASISVVGDRFVVAMAGAAGGSAGASTPQGGTAPACAPAPSSKRLAANMEAAGVHRPPGTDTHHIVAANAEAASTARAVLRRFGIDIDDAANGVFLPSNSSVVSAAPGLVHSTVHTKRYYDAVTARLRLARSRQDVLDALDNIRQTLLSGALP